MSTYTGAWLAWILMFLVIEGAAVLKKDWSGTLTSHVQELFRVKSSGHGWRKAGLGIFLLWLLIHLMGWG